MICVFPSGTDLVLPEVTANKITESDPAVGYVGYRHHSAVSAMCVMRSKRVLRYEFSCKHLIIMGIGSWQGALGPPLAMRK